MEITHAPEYSADEETLLEMHSVLNVLNVVIYELMMLSEEVGDAQEVDLICAQVVDASRKLSDPEEAYRLVANADALVGELESCLAAFAERKGIGALPVFVEKRDNLRSVCEIIKVRAAEITQRRDHPDAWVEHDIVQLKNNFLRVFQAIERNSHGRYRIVYNVAQHEERDYLVMFDIASVDGKTIRMPAVMQDVMRDLLANARKYTHPGGTIQAGLYHSGTELRFVVFDNGCGIMPDELESVVRFGVRGSNVQNHPTRGAGFGLTKAHYVTRKFGGRMWIFSKGEAGAGTRIELRIPVPGAV